MLSLQPPPKVITFDCYGTLVQWQAALRRVAEAILARHGADGAQGQAGVLVERVREAAVAQQRPPYRSYRAVLRTALDAALPATGYQATDADHETLWSGLGRIAPWPDVPSALSQLRTRYQLAIISNTDDALIAGTVAAIGVTFDHVITAEQARAYKPDHGLFHLAHAAMGVSPDETIHVGMGQFTDLKLCWELGIRSVWIDRDGEPPNPNWPPHASLPSLTGLPALLGVEAD
jgi:2-haloacid dehalogenase